MLIVNNVIKEWKSGNFVSDQWFLYVALPCLVEFSPF